MTGDSRQPPTVVWSIASFLVTFVVVATIATRSLLADSIMGLYLGRYIMREGIPRVDTLTVEGASRPWVDQQWLSQLLYFGAHQLGGYGAVGLLSAVSFCSAFALLAWILVRRGVPGLQAVSWCGIALVVCINNTFVRAQSFAVPLFVVTIMLLLADDERGRFAWRTWLAMLAVFAVWANLHGSLLLVIPFVAAWCAWQAVQSAREPVRRGDAWRYAGAALAIPATIFATPYGLDILAYYRSVMANETIAKFITEWQPATFTSSGSIPFLVFIGLLIVAVSFMWGRGRRPPLLPLAMTVWFGLIGTQALRYHIWVAFPGVILLSSVLALPTSTDAGSLQRARRLLLPPGIALLATAIVISVSYFTRPDEAWIDTAPLDEIRAAAEYLEEHPKARILADDPSAPLLLWLHPEVTEGRIAFDARLEHFAEEDLLGLFLFVEALGPEWLDITRDYDVLLVSRLYHPRAVRMLEREEGWRTLESSSDGILLVRE